MDLLVAIGILSILLGLLLLISQRIIKGFSAYFDKVVFRLDEAVIRPGRVWIGIVLLIISVWLIYMVNSYPATAQALLPIWGIALLVGILLLALPDWLYKVSEIANSTVVYTDKIIMGAGKLFGIVFILLGLYILYIVYFIYFLW